MSEKKPSKEKQPERRYQGEQEVDHDLFKLSISPILKNHGYDTKNPIYRTVDHMHHFHSYDSGGKMQTHCTPVAGHTHKCEMVKGEDGELKLEVGPAVQKKGKKWVLYALEENSADLNIPGVDGVHSHDATYIVSEKIIVRKKNLDATKMLAERRS